MSKQRLQKDESKEKLVRVQRKLYKLEEQRKKLTDIFIDDKITKEAYDEKYNELSFKIDRVKKEKSVISDNSLIQKSIKERMEEIRLSLIGLKWIKHKNYIETQINYLKERIESEQIDEILKGKNT